MTGQYLRNTDVTQVYQLQGIYLSYPQIVPQVYNDFYINKEVTEMPNNVYDEVEINKEIHKKV